MEIRDLGDIVNISSIPEFDEATDIPEGAKNDADSIVLSGQQLVINKRTAKDYIPTKRAQLQSLPFMDNMRDKAVFSIQKKMQSDIIAATIPSGGNTIAYDSGTTLALSDLLEGKELLDGFDVPMEGRCMINAVAQHNDLFNVTGFTSRDFIPAGSPLTAGDFTTPVLGFTPKHTSVLSDVTYLFHPSYLTMAIQDSLNIQAFDMGVDGVRASRVNVDVLWGLKQLDNNRVVKIG